MIRNVLVVTHVTIIKPFMNILFLGEKESRVDGGREGGEKSG